MYGLSQDPQTANRTTRRMRSEKQAARRREIEAAAFEALMEKGYASVSMLTIAKRAGASNETLYRWYGNKAGLFRALVESNAETVAAPLRNAIEAADAPLDILSAIAPRLLALLTGPRAIALNRAAAADAEATGALGRALAAAGREAVAPLIARALARALNEDEARLATEDFIALLVGDLQIRCVTGAIEPLSSEEAAERASRAIEKLRRLYPPLAG